MSEGQFDEDDDWDDEESVDEDDISFEEDGDDDGLTGGGTKFGVPDIELDESHTIVRSNRALNFTFVVDVTVEVIEPPQVFNAQIEQILKRLLREAATGVKLGTVTRFSVENRTLHEEDDE